MDSQIAELIETLDNHAKLVKDTKAQLKDLVEATSMYKTVYESSVSTNDENGFEVSDKDAAKHAYSVTLKNIRKMISKK